MREKGTSEPPTLQLPDDIDADFDIQQTAIYRYWSIPRGLNYIAEKSGFDYAEGDFEHEADSAVIDQFTRKLLEIVSNLVCDLVVQLKKETSIPVANLYAALKNRVLVYNGGGSTKPFLAGSIGDFTDVMLIDSTMWKEENLKDKARVSPLCSLLTTAATWWTRTAADPSTHLKIIERTHMKTTKLLRYTRSILADEYAMQVLLYSIARTIVTNGYSLRGITSIRISAKFLAKSATIDIIDHFHTHQNAFAVLLSLMALSLRTEWIKNCYNDSLLFGEFTHSRYEWVQYYTYIQECLSDNVFSLLFSLLQKTCSDAPLTKQDREAFVQAFPEPEYRNLIGFFQKFASTHTGVARECICNNALLCNDQITTYLVSPSVVYIGDTAFAYCSNLRRIQIQNPNTAFGRFPIIACDKLTHILVPEGTEEQFREALPYYKDSFSVRKLLPPTPLMQPLPPVLPPSERRSRLPCHNPPPSAPRLTPSTPTP